MGMELIPREQKGKTTPLQYSFSAWWALVLRLEKWGMDMNEFAGLVAGKPLKAETCAAVADCLDSNMALLTAEEQGWFKGTSEIWRTFSKAGGCLRL
jgi:hypothetical protein